MYNRCRRCENLTFVPKSMTLYDLERPKHTLAEKNRFTEPTRKNLNEDRPRLSMAKCRPMILVSRNMRYMRIFARGTFLGEGASIVSVTYLGVVQAQLRPATTYRDKLIIR